MPSARLVGAGAFILAGIILFTVALFMIGERRQIFADRFEIYTEFAKLSGLQMGATVRVAGMEAGEVVDIQVPPGPASKFRVKMRVVEKLHGLVRTDSVATIQTEGLVGGNFLQISAGSEKAPPASEKSTIPSREPFEVADLLKQMGDTVATIHTTILALRGDIDSTVATIAETAEHADALIEVVGEDVRSISDSGNRIASDTRAMMESIRAGRGTIGKLLNDDELYVRMRDMTTQAEQAVRNVRQVTEEARQTLTSLRSKEGPAQGLASDLRQTISYAREALSDLADNTEALKRNFFFRGFFNRRGYFDLSDVTAVEYRQKFLSSRHPPLRIWLAADVLFATAADGEEQITDGGKARLDSAMAELMKYIGRGPLILEGYASQGSLDQKYLASRARAAMVREYLVSKFYLAPQSSGFIPLGDQAAGSPNGDRWDGVALAVFVTPEDVEAVRSRAK